MRQRLVLLIAFAFASSLHFEQVKSWVLSHVLVRGTLNVLEDQLVLWVTLLHQAEAGLQAVVNVVNWVDCHLSVQGAEQKT